MGISLGIASQQSSLFGELQASEILYSLTKGEQSLRNDT